MDYANWFVIAAFVEPVQPIPVVAIASSVTAGIVLLILILAIVSGIGVWLKVRQLRTPLNIVIEEPSDARLRSFKTAIPDIIITGCVIKALKENYALLDIFFFFFFLLFMQR